VLRRSSKRPTHRVDDAVERPRDLPHLLHAERPDLRTVPSKAETLESDAGEVPLCSLRQDGHASYDVGARLEIAERLTVSAASLEETAERARIDNCSGQEMRAGLFPLVEDGDGNLAEPFPDLGRVLEQLAETDRTREPSRARADDEDTDLDALVGRVARRRD